jgi:hypothetical protein
MRISSDDSKVYQIIVVIDPDVLDGLLLHLLHLEIGEPHLLPYLERANRFSPDRDGDQCTTGSDYSLLVL